jgi:serine protease AprX
VTARQVGERNLRIYRALTRAGARILRLSVVGNTIEVLVPPHRLAHLANHPDIQAIARAPEPRPLNIGQESAAIGAPTWWAGGYTGGRGRADLPATFSVDQDPVLQSHPAFFGIRFETPSGATQGSPSTTRHGTALLSIAAAQGPSGCPLCHPADVEEKGVAYGVGKVLDPSGAGAETDWAAGVPYYWYDNALGEWKLQAPARDPAQVINYSRGADANYDDSLIAQAVDATVNDYGVTMTVAAGNSGPAPRTVNDPALAYNVIGVGAFSGGGTTDPSDDTVFGWSSRGPTVGGRKKPDLVAVGDGSLAYSYYQSTGKLWKYDTGTSYAAPQVGAGAILLAGAGIRDPKVVKAILIDSARPGRATPAESMGSQTTWLPDWGWGEMDLDAAYRERYNFARDEVPPNSARFFRATVKSAGDRATLVWNRRVADCKPLRQGCYYDAQSGFRVYTLSNLDLTEYEAPTGVPSGLSNSTVDNVEQVRASAPGSVIYKVSAGDVDTSTGEPFALAATRPLTPLVTPQPTTTLTTSTGGTIRAGESVTVVAEIANPSPDLTAEHAHVALEVPAGVEIVEGQQTQTFGTLNTRGAQGDRATASWVVRGLSDGIKRLVATTGASRYGSTFRTSATGSFTVDAVPPQVTLSTPTAATANASIPVAWGGSDDRSPVASFDVEVATDNGTFTRLLTATDRTSATFVGRRGSRYRFRVRATDALANVSEFVTSAEIAVPSADPNPVPPPPGPTPPPDRHPARLPSPQLKVTRVRRIGSRLFVNGTVARGANGRLTAVWSASVRGRRRVAYTSAHARRRSFAMSLKIPRVVRRARLTVTYLGGRDFERQSRHLSLRLP